MTDSNEPSFEKLALELKSLEAIVAGWDDANHKNTVSAIKKTIDEFHGIALSRLIRIFRKDSAALALLKEAAGDEFVYAVLRHHNLLKPSINERVESALQSVRPALQSHGGDVELVRIEPPSTVLIRLLGTCNNCPAVDITFIQGVEKAIKEYCPEITEVKKSNIASMDECGKSELVQFLSPFAGNVKEDWIRIAALPDLPECQMKSFEFEGKSILLYREKDKLYCYHNACAHMGLPLDGGLLVDDIITCPHHGFKFYIKSGECLSAPEVQLQVVPIRVIGNDIEIPRRFN